MKGNILTLCVFIALSSLANAAMLYKCIDSKGNIIISDNPPQNAKCESMGTVGDLTPRESEKERQQIESERKTILNVVGMTLSQAKEALAQAGANSITYSQRPTIDRSLDQKVYAQTPAPGQPIAGTVVLGYYQFHGVMPNVVGLTLDQAKNALIQAGVPGDMITINPLPINTPSLDQKVLDQVPRSGEPIFGTVVLEYYRSDR
jgi:beta-lactam-binding protein with PASTA domain